jgi:hypothetical protein
MADEKFAAGENSGDQAAEPQQEGTHPEGIALGEMAEQVASFARERPWTAMLCAFVVGYTVAQIAKRLS